MLRLMDVAFMGALLCSMSLNVVQTQKIRQLTAVPEEALKKGARMPPIAAKTVDGEDAVIAPAKVPLVLYFFSESCRWCEANSQKLNALERQVRGRYEVAGVSLSKVNLRGYASRHVLSLPLYHSADADALAQYGIKGTPQTVLLSPDGRVIESWMGAYRGAVKESVERTLDVRLPGS